MVDENTVCSVRAFAFEMLTPRFPKICAHLRNLRILSASQWMNEHYAKQKARPSFPTAGLLKLRTVGGDYAAAKFASACAQFTTAHHAFT